MVILVRLPYKASLSEYLSLLNEHMSIHMKILDDYRHIDYHSKLLSILYKQTKYGTRKMLCELIGLTEKILDKRELDDKE